MKILFVHSGMPVFAKTDFDILSESNEVDAFDFPSLRHGWWKVIKCLPALWEKVQWADLTFSWFGKLHAFFAVLFSNILKKKSIVVLSGGEVCRFSFKGGAYRSICAQPIKNWFPRYVVRHADMLLPVSEYVLKEAIENIGADRRRIKKIYHGFDINRFHISKSVKKNGSVVTVGEIMDENLYHKRFLEFIAAAKLLSDVSFLLIGPDHDGTAEKIKKDVSVNLILTGGLYDKDLINRFNQASVYVQGSSWESFGCAVAEAMACECVPVVSNLPALREVVGDCGIYLDEPVTPEEIASKIKEALQHPELGKKARQRIISNFSLDRRRRELLEAVALKYNE
jgi:glycosyltransferase involved in cell wall biosynthesis